MPTTYRPAATLTATCAAILLAAALLPVPATAQPSEQPAPAGPPDWFVEHMEAMTGSGGVWDADNSAYKSEAEPYDAYRSEWRWGIDRKSMIGRLVALQAGEEVLELWQYRVFWHPAERQVYIYQWGRGGTLAIGTVTQGEGGAEGASVTRAEQQLFGPRGGGPRIGHRTEATSERLVIESFQIDQEGSWIPQRRYVWRPPAV